MFAYIHYTRHHMSGRIFEGESQTSDYHWSNMMENKVDKWYIQLHPIFVPREKHSL